MGNRLSGNRRREIPRSASAYTFQRVWSRTSRRRRSVNSLTDPYLASRTTWPVPRTEAMFLPEYTVNPRSAEKEYKVLHQINRGAYGEVLKVQQQSDKKVFAMKVMSKQEIIRNDAVKQCKDEVCIQRMVGHHAFIVQIHKTWQNKIHLHIVMDYATHGDLYTLWLLEGAFSEAAVQLYVAELALVVDFLHNAGIVFRDLKMENILLDHDGHIRLTDFGLAKWLKRGTRTNTICGTLQYMAPEILREDPYYHAIDWWSLGIITYTLLTGSFPVKGAPNHHLMCSKVLHTEYSLPTSCSAEANEMITRLLCKDAPERLQSLPALKELSFLRPLNFEQLQKRKLQPKSFLKRKLPATLARRTKNGKKFICDKQSTELNIENFDWLRVTAL
ncbi:putative serine/threonine-protein kinase F31E3.2 isoform X2 [Acanthaster planci]|uniref:Serine/threonine-protein kinase F31E3.2 isoform X2 n=1 Tax=Acanthaster planci TaxID=133434 RepID=A0A8B7ZAZ0_ACAPL|nr:putative serine/threonine-protein kinase F31E3.2 isoform X2 [Acanthaster planci]